MPRDLQDKGPLLRAAVIGCGHVGAIHAEALATHDRVELVAVCDPLLDRAAALARRWGGEAFRDWQKLLASTSPDLVAIATPDDAHVKPTLAFLESGSHVFCEKPLAVTLAEAKTMVATAKRFERTLAVDFNRRFGFAYQRTRDLIENARIGRPAVAALQVIDRFPARARSNVADRDVDHTAHASFRPRPLVGWRGDRGSDDGHIGCRHGPRHPDVHHAPLSRRRSRHRDLQLSAPSGPDVGVAHDRRPRGILIAEDVVGPLTFRDADSETVETFAPPADCWQNAFWRTIRQHVGAFVESIASDRPPPVTGDDGVASLRIATAAALSWTERTAVEINDVE